MCLGGPASQTRTTHDTRMASNEALSLRRRHQAKEMRESGHNARARWQEGPFLVPCSSIRTWAGATGSCQASIVNWRRKAVKTCARMAFAVWGSSLSTPSWAWRQEAKAQFLRTTTNHHLLHRHHHHHRTTAAPGTKRLGHVVMRAVSWLRAMMVSGLWGPVVHPGVPGRRSVRSSTA